MWNNVDKKHEHVLVEVGITAWYPDQDMHFSTHAIVKQKMIILSHWDKDRTYSKNRYNFQYGPNGASTSQYEFNPGPLRLKKRFQLSVDSEVVAEGDIGAWISTTIHGLSKVCYVDLYTLERYTDSK